MNRNATLFASLVFLVIGVALVMMGWPPGRASLLKDQAKIVRVVAYPGTRYNVEWVTSVGVTLSCVENGLRNWPPAAINRCPIEAFEPYVGRTVTVLHDGRYVYDVRCDGHVILSYSVFRRFQIMMTLVGFLMAGIGVVTWRRAVSTH